MIRTYILSDINRLSCLVVLPLVIVALHEVIIHAHFPLKVNLISCASLLWEIATAVCDGSHRVYHLPFENILSRLNKEINSIWVLSVYSFR